ncbi:hypothetical protein AVEN_133087-1 [Araneus ventricosus]|uniref:Uncharacterized protein n=1 Tax=Araneus ventricosus TaxID=182803 RepID=A0A4Y2WTE1_ARAVE|nr:hypothetical protein AVEN_133087-1 [Araneus ventricosus]
MDPELRIAIEKAVDKRFMKGKNQETRQHHHITVLREVAEILNLPLPCEQEYQLQQLLGMKFCRSDLGTLIDNWVRKNMIGPEKLIKTRELFTILGVDGFNGIGDFKAYLNKDNNSHFNGVVNMYKFLDTSIISSLTGTDSACVVFLALLKLFSTKIVDDQARIVMEQIKNKIESFMHRHAQYYRDIHLVNDNILNALIRVYVNTNPNWFQHALERTNILLKNKKIPL